MLSIHASLQRPVLRRLLRAKTELPCRGLLPLSEWQPTRGNVPPKILHSKPLWTLRLGLQLLWEIRRRLCYSWLARARGPKITHRDNNKGLSGNSDLLMGPIDGGCHLSTFCPMKLLSADLYDFRLSFF